MYLVLHSVLPVKLTWIFGFEDSFLDVVLTTVLLLNQLSTMTWFSEGFLVCSSSGITMGQLWEIFSLGGLNTGLERHWGNWGGGNDAGKLEPNCCEEKSGGIWRGAKCGGMGGGGMDGAGITVLLGWLNHGRVGGRGGGGICVSWGFKDPGCTFIGGSCFCDPWFGYWFIMTKVVPSF